MDDIGTSNCKKMTSETKEVTVSTVKSLFGAVPYVGQLLNEVAFDYRSRIKQNRLNQFTVLLSEYFERAGGVNTENIKNEEFSDLFESVLRRVTQTKSEKKHKRFRDILINQIENSNHSIDNSETYLDLISSLNEIEIEILKAHVVFDETYYVKDTEFNAAQNKLVQKEELLKKEIDINKKGHANNSSKVESEVVELKSFINTRSEELRHLQKFRQADYYNISKNDFLYYKQMLYAKGLLIDVGIGAIETAPFQSMAITEFGKKFIEYIIRPS